MPKMSRNRAVAVVLAIALLLSALGAVINGWRTDGTDGEGSAAPPPVTAAPAPDGVLRIVFLDVGQADAAYFELDGHRMLIDGGNKADSSLLFSFLKRQGATSLDYIINTHPDEDHVGGLAGALNAARAGQAFSSVTEHDTAAFSNFKAAVEKQGLSIKVPKSGDVLPFGDAEVVFVQPEKDYGNTNDDSLVVRIAYKGVSVLITGDIGRDVERDMVEEGASIGSDILKVAHHGSRHSTSYIFLRAVDPGYSVISVGKDNGYGHPTEDALSRLKDHGGALFRTDIQGDVVFETDGSNIHVAVQKNAAADVFAPNDRFEEPQPGSR